jgi:hypothetical protein
MKDKKNIGFNEKLEVIAEIDAAAESEGLDRSGWVRRTIRNALRSAGDSK